MKSIAAVLALASLAVASPLDIHVHTGSSAARSGLHDHFNNDVCWLACFEEKPDCPSGLYAKEIGECWTCCLKGSAQQKEKAKTIDLGGSDAIQSGLHASYPICWAACFPSEPTCPEKWYSDDDGGCWTCCLKPESTQHEEEKTIDLVKSNAVQSGLQAQGEFCFPACTPEPPFMCPQNWYAKNMGSCWSCCVQSQSAQHEGMKTIDLLVELNAVQSAQHKEEKTIDLVKSNAVQSGLHTQEIYTCFDVCSKVPIADACPGDWYSHKVGDCWTCCVDKEKLEGVDLRLDVL